MTNRMEEAFGACLCGELIEIDYNLCNCRGFAIQRTSLQASRSPGVRLAVYYQSVYMHATPKNSKCMLLISPTTTNPPTLTH